MNEVKNPNSYFFQYDELYPMQTYKGQPEFELFNRENFQADSPETLPQITFTSSTSANELLPQHDDNTLDWQKLHPELESWTAFRALPELMKFDSKMIETMDGVVNGFV